MLIFIYVPFSLSLPFALFSRKRRRGVNDKHPVTGQAVEVIDEAAAIPLSILALFHGLCQESA